MEDQTKTPPVETAESQPQSNLIQNCITVEALEQALRSVLPKRSRMEWLAVFPEARTEYLLPKIRELESEIAELEKVAAMKLKQSKRITDGWLVREAVKAFEIADLVNLKREYHRLKRYFPAPATSGRIDQDQIERAKLYPILEIAEAHLQGIKRCGRAYRSLCPYHNERTPSFYLYPATNTFHCFGCCEHGDVIALVQHFLSMNFVEAIKHLAV